MLAVIIVLVVILVYYLYQKYIKVGPVQTVVLFYRDGCPWCDLIKPEWKQVENSLGIRAKKIDTLDAKNADFVKIYKVDSVPTIILLDIDGKYDKYEGNKDAQSMITYFRKRIFE